MNKIEKRDLAKDIFKMRLLTLEQNLYVIRYYIEAYINIHLTFKEFGPAKMDINNLLDEYTCIINEEKLLLKLLIKYSKNIDYDEAQNLLSILDEMNDNLLIEYYDYFDRIDDGCSMKQEYRASLYTRRTEKIVDSDKYRKMFTGLLLKDRDIKEFLDYPEEFWNSIEIIYTDDEKSWGFHFGKLILPRVINLETIEINIELLEQAYNEFTNSESNKKEEFDKYLVKRMDKIFK